MASQSQQPVPRFEPCASTASLFLYAQGPVITCLHHDTLAVERRFTSHQDNIDFISVDNVSERGAGRLVVSYDVGQTAIVWDIFTGTEIARFASFEHLSCFVDAQWSCNGKGEVILFEPPTSEHVSARTIFDPITSLAPATDCRTYAIGYQNGSILIANLLPQFTILHTLTTSSGPSPIISLAWHASSSKQKSDMLATQASNGDLRVWSVAKPPGKEAPRVIRVLKRSDSTSSDPKWMAWSKNGKIVQYLEGETWSWDVRTKHVTYEPIPTVPGVRGMASYGPTATLFTIGPQDTVQQYDLDAPALVANVQHHAITSRTAASEGGRSRTISPRRLHPPPEIRERGNGRRTPFDTNGIESAKQARADLTSPASSRSRTESVSSKASSGKYKMDRPFSPPSRSAQSGTSFSMSGRDTPQPSASYAYASSISMSSAKSSRAGSRLRNEVHMSPAERNIVDLFPFTRARLNDVPYKQTPPLDEARLTPDDLRRQMLSVVFGWDGDIDDLLRDELSRHKDGSQSAILLTRWLNENNAELLADMLGPGQVTMADWMILALSQMSGQTQANKAGQAFVQKLLEIGDIHTAASVLLAMGDSNDAIEVYVSQNHFMEAILMTCLLMPTDWQRQSYLVRRWGEFVVSHSQQQLAIRCFMCTGAEPTEPWTSPAAQQAASFADIMRGKSPLTSPEPIQPLGPSLMPPPSRPKSGASQRPAGKTPALKLITSFDHQPNQKFRFPGLKSDDRTPTNAPGVTPIAESAVADSALSPGGFGSYKLNNIQSLSQAMASRTNTPAFNRRRLPSIGETPVDVHPPTFSRSRSYNTSNYGSTSENDDTSAHEHSQDEQAGDMNLLTLSSARYNPTQESQSMKPSPQTAVQAPEPFAALKGLPSPAPGFIEALREHSDLRNGSRDRKPNGLQIDLVQTEEASLDSQGLLPSGKSTTSTFNSYASAKSPSVSGRSIDQYISSLDEANYHARKQSGRRTPGQGRRNAEDTSSQQGSRSHHARDVSQETRGRNERRYIQPAKRSPSSPVPMSPEELARYHTESEKPRDSQRKNSSRARSRSKMRKAGSRSRQRSSSRHTASRLGGDRQEVSSRGRSVDRNGSGMRSPSSPLPMALPQQDAAKADGQDDPLRLVSGDRQRLRSRHRSASRRRTERGASAQRDESLEPRHRPSQSVPEVPRNLELEVRQQETELEQLSAKVFGQENHFANGSTQRPNPASDDAEEVVSPTTPYVSLAERKRRELAAAELEARRLSLARNPSAPNIPFPGDLHNARSPLESPPMVSGSYFPMAPSRNKGSASKTSPGYHSGSDSSSSRSGAPLGLPATPRAMRHPKYGVNGHEVERPPSVPTIPSDYSNGPLLSDARYQGEAERIGRSMSVPAVQAGPAAASPPVSPEIPMHPRFNPHLPRSRSSSRSRNMSHRRTSSGGGYVSGTSQPVTISIEETIDASMQRRPSGVQIELIPPPPPPPILPELQHLNTPPPPPPIPSSTNPVSPRESSATIDVAIDHVNIGRLLPRAMTAAPALSGPENRQNNGQQRMSFEHRRNRSSNESFANKLRSLTRMRSNSRSVEPWGNTEAEWPYDDEPLTNGHGNGLESRPF
ncbi:PGC-1 family protein [Penicillium ucsense]|uniref:PGC-1 family protein n=1 Tax=Penicillium ucsense TaxID=2839758 RepID=A0A8J8W1L6_9EURO|nr:PGC-1 family protein [Penicillium ucsense]